ncbi:MAG: DMT family transporter [Pseudomonadota bacterium]
MIQRPVPSHEIRELPPGAVLLTAFLCILFGANAVAVKIAMTGIGIFTSAALRFTLAGITLFLWAKCTGQTLAITRSQALKLIIVSACFTVQLSCFYVGLSKTSASHGTLIGNLLPFIVLVLAHIFIPGDRITVNKLLGLTLGFAGIGFLFFDTAAANPDIRSGDLIILAAVVIWGCNAVYVKTIISGFSAIQITLYPMIVATPLFFLAGWLWDGQMIRFMDTRVINAILYQSFVTASFGFVAWNTLLKKFGATALHSFVFIMPLAGVFSGVMLLDEPMTINLGASIVCVALGIVIVHRKPRTAPAIFGSDAAMAPAILSLPLESRTKNAGPCTAVSGTPAAKENHA